MWASLKRIGTTALEQNIPTKMSSTRHTHPLVSTSLRRMMRRKQRAHRKAKTSGQSKAWDRFKRLLLEVQPSTRTAHRRYMADVVCNERKENTKHEAGDWDCVAAVERLPALHYSVDFIFLSFGIMGFIVDL